MPPRFELKCFPDDQALATAAAKDWLALVQKSAGPYAVALSGGRIAKTFFDAIANLARNDNISLANVEFFWADERCVPPTDPESNFLLARENLLTPLAIGDAKIHRLKGEAAPTVAVSEASHELRSAVPTDSAGTPILDMIFLGLGEDGHVASLMPNAPPEILASRETYVHVANSPKPPPHRLSLTYPVLAAARTVWALVAGAGKADALGQSLRPDGATPFARVLQSRPLTVIYTDLNEMAPGRSK